MNDTMEAISQEKLGGPEVLESVSLPRPTPGIGEVLVRVHAASVNPLDKANRERGLLTGQPPFVLGYDVSGTVSTSRNSSATSMSSWRSSVATTRPGRWTSSSPAASSSRSSHL